jgi:hypothetical protein
LNQYISNFSHLEHLCIHVRFRQDLDIDLPLISKRCGDLKAFASSGPCRFKSKTTVADENPTLDDNHILNFLRISYVEIDTNTLLYTAERLNIPYDLSIEPAYRDRKGLLNCSSPTHDPGVVLETIKNHCSLHPVIPATDIYLHYEDKEVSFDFGECWQEPYYGPRNEEVFSDYEPEDYEDPYYDYLGLDYYNGER